MASILLIEHQTIVGDAIRHFLFPQHRVVLSAEPPAPEELRAYDLAIIDTESVLKLGQTLDGMAGLLAGAEVPVVWICPAENAVPASDPASRVVTKPLEPEAFRGAVEGLLAEKEPPREEHVIELTDVIAEDSPDEGQN